MKKQWHQYVGIRAAIIIAVGGIIVAAMYIWNSRSELKQSNVKYKNEMKEKDARITDLQQQLSQKDVEIQRLETQLTPFKTIALEKYTGSEQEALEKLAQSLKIIESKTAALENQLTPRKLTPEQIAVIAEQISLLKGIKVHFLLIASDPEAESFKEQIKKALETGGWIIEKNEISVVGAFTGITLFASQDPPNEAISTLSLTFKEFGFTPELIRNKDLPKDVIKIKIGKKK